MPANGGTRWGYHRLSDTWATRVVHRAGIRPGELVLDVGAGTGALTVPLLAAGARVVAIELHPGRARLLRERFGPSVVVVQADGADLRLPRRPFRVVANPPFAITTALLRRLLSPGTRLVSADLVVPAHAALRWAGGRGPGAGRWSRDFSARVALRLPSGAYRPASPLPTAVLRLERHQAGAADPHAPPATDERAFSCGAVSSGAVSAGAVSSGAVLSGPVPELEGSVLARGARGRLIPEAGPRPPAR